MPGKIFISYRRDDVAGDARGLRDGLAGRFGRANVFMDIDNLLPGQRFDRKLAEALSACDVLIAVIGPRWMELLAAKTGSGDPDYVRQEIGEALKRGIVVIPVRVGLDGRMPDLPRREDLPDDLRDLVLHQKHDVVHEHFGRDLAALAKAIVEVRRDLRPPRSPVPWRWVGAAAGVFAIVLVALYAWPEGKPAFSPSRAAAPLTAAEERALRPKDPFKECADCPEMVVVPAGSFTMGSPPDEKDRDADEGPQHSVKIERPFAVGKFEVTFAEWDACVAAERGCKYKPGDEGWGRGNRPVINVSWDDAQEYVKWLSVKTGKSYRLLTEAEWEYAAGGVTSASAASRRYWWGDKASHEYANYGKDQCCGGLAQGRDQWVNTAPVGQFPANPFGLHDMHGNVYEWVQDCWHDNYSGAPADGSAWTTGDCSRGVLRGGSWNYTPWYLRSANRYRYPTDYRNYYFGFRVGRTF